MTMPPTIERVREAWTWARTTAAGQLLAPGAMVSPSQLWRPLQRSLVLTRPAEPEVAPPKKHSLRVCRGVTKAVPMSLGEDGKRRAGAAEAVVDLAATWPSPYGVIPGEIGGPMMALRRASVIRQLARFEVPTLTSVVRLWP